MTISVGTYLKLRREAAFLSIDDIAAKFSTEPRYAEHIRADLLRRIEADETPASFMTIVVLAAIYPIDMNVLVALAVEDHRRPVPPLCRVCACSHNDPCIDQVMLTTCHWVGPDLCSTCSAPVEWSRLGQTAAAA